jgi:dynein heavy chain
MDTTRKILRDPEYIKK